MYHLPPPTPTTPAEHAAAAEPMVIAACQSRKTSPNRPFPVKAPAEVDAAAFFAAVAEQMRGTGWTLVIVGDDAYPEPA